MDDIIQRAKADREEYKQRLIDEANDKQSLNYADNIRALSHYIKGLEMISANQPEIGTVEIPNVDLDFNLIVRLMIVPDSSARLLISTDQRMIGPEDSINVNATMLRAMAFTLEKWADYLESSQPAPDAPGEG